MNLHTKGDPSLPDRRSSFVMGHTGKDWGKMVGGRTWPDFMSFVMRLVERGTMKSFSSEKSIVTQREVNRGSQNGLTRRAPNLDNSAQGYIVPTYPRTEERAIHAEVSAHYPRRRRHIIHAEESTSSMLKESTSPTPKQAHHPRPRKAPSLSTMKPHALGNT